MVLTVDQLNRNVIEMKYDVRGELYLAAEKRVREGKEVIFTNVGNPHAMGEKPLTFPRQVVALCCYPQLLEDPDITKKFKSDVIARAKTYLSKAFKGGIGAYTDSRGSRYVREEVASFIHARDGGPSPDPDHIFFTNGAGAGVQAVVQMLIRDHHDAIMTPIPQYPLYSASINVFGGSLLPYQLDEDNAWSFNFDQMSADVAKSKKEGKHAKALVVINPGNPTGACLEKEKIEGLIKFAHQHKIVLLADEVYQENVYQTARPFLSIRKVLHQMGAPYSKEVEVISFHTVSKGAFGECGWRGGYIQMENMDEQVAAQLYKIMSVQLSPAVPAQVILGCLVNPPKVGDASYENHQAERQTILDSLTYRAKFMTDMFNSLEGVTCTFTEGAMYSLPQIRLPAGALAAAKSAGKPADVFYSLALLNATGISVVPGAAFGQKDGTYHFRTTILPPKEKMDDIKSKFSLFHQQFMDQYRHSVPAAKL